MKIEVIDNFLSDYEFKSLTNEILNDYFPWYFNEGRVFIGDGSYQFTHLVYNIKRNGVMSNYFSLFHPILEKLGASELDRIKLNLNPKTVFHRKAGWHTDQRSPKENLPFHKKTAVLFMNTNNGYTKFKKSGKIVKSVANRIVIFDSDLYHTGFTCTDNLRRVLMNCNYS